LRIFCDDVSKMLLFKNKLKDQGQIFTVGTSADLLYTNSGGSIDWARGTANIPYSYVLELRPGDGKF
jgi:hypothetical protein